MKTDQPNKLNFGLIGVGDVAQTILRFAGRDSVDSVQCTSVLVRSMPMNEPAKDLVGSHRVACDIAELLDPGMDVVLDCAGHTALSDYGEAILANGSNLLSASSGALADQGLLDRLRAAAREYGKKLIVPAGAIAGIDGLAAARHAGLTKVEYQGCKPALAWRGTKAENIIDLGNLDAPYTFYRGSAREAALLYPKNANVCATVALAGIGFDDTQVSLVADPHGVENIHRLSFEGAFGNVSLEIKGKPSLTNPKTSMLTALSMWRALLNQSKGAIVV